MRRKSHATDLSSEEIVKDIRRATREQYSGEEITYDYRRDYYPDD